MGGARLSELPHGLTFLNTVQWLKIATACRDRPNLVDAVPLGQSLPHTLKDVTLAIEWLVTQNVTRNV